MTLTAAPGTASLGSGPPAAAWLYDGQLPGPVIRVTEGELWLARHRYAPPELGRIAALLQVFQVAVRMAGFALGGGAEDGGHVVVTLDVRTLGEIQVTAVGL